MVYYFYFFHFYRHRIGINVAVWRCGGVAVIVPQSTMVGKTKDDKAQKHYILDHHTLEGVNTNPKKIQGCYKFYHRDCFYNHL